VATSTYGNSSFFGSTLGRAGVSDTT
jgi:hypothetical protein